MKFQAAILALVWLSTLSISFAENEPILPTSSFALATSIKESNAVMVCRLVDIGWVDFLEPGENRYEKAVFDVITQFKGTVSSRVVCSFRVKVLADGKHEEPPQVGKDYIVVGSSESEVFVIQKLAPATTNNLREVKRVLGDSSSIAKVAENPAMEIEHKSPMWPWVVGILALLAIVAAVLKRRT